MILLNRYFTIITGSSLRVNNYLIIGIIYPVYKSRAASEETDSSSPPPFPAGLPGSQVPLFSHLLKPSRLLRTGTSYQSRLRSGSLSNSWTRSIRVPWVIRPRSVNADWSVRAPQRRHDFVGPTLAPRRHLRLRRLETGQLINLLLFETVRLYYTVITY